MLQKVNRLFCLFVLCHVIGSLRVGHLAVTQWEEQVHMHVGARLTSAALLLSALAGFC